MGILAKLFGVDGPLTAIITNLLDRLGLTPEQKAQMQQHMIDVQAAADQADRDLDAKLNDIAGQNIRAETQSQSWIARNARPLFLVGMTMVCFFNIMVPLLGQHWQMQPVEIPGPMFDLFGAGFLGYTAARSFDKKNGKAQ